MRNQTLGGQGRPKIALRFNFAGVYVLYNASKNKYYVGQGQEILNRVNSHFTGKGNGDVYADYKYGDVFTIKMIDISKTEYSSLNALEKDAILTYDAYSKGYKKIEVFLYKRSIIITCYDSMLLSEKKYLFFWI